MVNKSNISRAISKIDSPLDMMSSKHDSGMYWQVNRRESYFYFQITSLDPSPSIPPIRHNGVIWNDIQSVNKQKTNEYISRIENNRERSKRVNMKRCQDEIDALILDEILKLNTISEADQKFSSSGPKKGILG